VLTVNVFKDFQDKITAQTFNLRDLGHLGFAAAQDWSEKHGILAKTDLEKDSEQGVLSGCA